ncbi:DNA-directed RNA polymerase subunit omega [Gleimia hominis]|uniref:DNA-directed RNA polymerase subunit omega n=1 Tax=Gleimia hominis TaxID=595468 RepID=A0ABU3IBB4_9ACTO|nr:DNA-directed RNA polymerase subunit omega [Gleimia hominis]MDT3767670.1 DNA-directed RNA polymerase subunit omega [Gleimia hominis]WIK65087.1 DNA-directed RNA polymerase subunit omega [Gleimia hominis]
MSGIVAHPEGITNPPIDDLMEKVDSKYALVVFAARRARQINSYNLQLESNMVQFVGPVVPVEQDEKPLSIALREISQDMLMLEQNPENVETK